MGLFDIFKKENEEENFFEWLDSVLKTDLPNETKAINFNIYEDVDNSWSIELVGAFEFDENDDDWACCEIFSTRDKPFVIVRKSEWTKMETMFIDWVNKYLYMGKYSDKLKQYQAVGLGFVDGILNILYKQ